MESNPLLFIIVALAALSTILSAMGVFSNSRPPDPRLNQVATDLEDIKNMLAQLQKAVLQSERKLEKEAQSGRSETREVIEKLADVIDKRLKELV